MGRTIAMPKVFRIEGTFTMGRKVQPFSLEFVAESSKSAQERCRSLLGSRHGVPRRLITIGTSNEVPPADVHDPVVRHQAQAA